MTGLPQMLAGLIKTDRDILSQEYEARQEIVPGIIPQGVTLLVGKPKKGKSWLTLNLANSVAHGKQALGSVEGVSQGKVLYLALEDTEASLKSRMLKIGESKGSENIYFVTKWPPCDAPLAILTEYLKAYPGIRLVVIDTLARFRPDRSGYARGYDDMGQLKSLAAQFGLAIVLVHHARKMKSKDSVDAVLGSTGLTGAVDSILKFDREDGMDDARLFITGREIEERELVLLFERSNCTWSIMGEGQNPIPPEKEEILEFLRNADGEHSLGGISEAVGKKGPVVSKHLAWLIDHRLIEKARYGYYRAVKAHEPDEDSTDPEPPTQLLLPAPDWVTDGEVALHEVVVTGGPWSDGSILDTAA